VVSVLWPSFLTAGVATVLFFTVFDPVDLGMLLGVEQLGRLEAYSIGFFLFWMLTSTSCALTCYFRKPCDELNPRRGG
jgi:hypothetical protein